MDLVVRAYDHEAVLRAERMPVQRLWTVLESGGMRDVAKARVGLIAPADVFARETVVARLEGLLQEGYAEISLIQLRGVEPPEMLSQRPPVDMGQGVEVRHDHGAFHPHWPAIGPEEAVALREDLVRYLTYSLWRAPEAAVARTLGLLLNTPDLGMLMGEGAGARGLREVLDAAEDQARFAEEFGQTVRAGLARSGAQPSDVELNTELHSLAHFLAPISLLLRDARAVSLRVIAYQDDPDGEGLTAFLRGELGQSEAAATPHLNGN